MRIAVLSGKGGTGKTTVATNLAKILEYTYVDCDVEEPNGFIFLKPEICESKDTSVLVPDINYESCNLCSKCVKACQFNALANTGKEIVLFEKLCHSCGACSLVCVENAIKETSRIIGRIDTGSHEKITCIQGKLNVGEAMAGPIISQIKSIDYGENAVLDCSPGSSCNVVKAVKDTDYAILVTEPTEFGLHDLNIAVELVKKMKIPFGVIINRSDEYKEMIESYCQEKNINLLGIILFDREIARLYSEGKLLTDDERYRQVFSKIAQKVEGVILCS